MKFGENILAVAIIFIVLCSSLFIAFVVCMSQTKDWAIAPDGNFVETYR